MNLPHDTIHTVLQTIIQVSRAAEFINEEMNVALSKLHITHTQYNILRILKRAGEGKGLSSNEIKRQLITQTIDLTRSINGLETLGYVTRVRHDTDRRVVLHYITQPGIAAIAEIDPILADLLTQMAANMELSEWKKLSELSEKLMHKS